MTLNTESATAMLIGNALEILMSDFDDFDPMEDISESLAPETDDCLEAADKAVEEHLRVARERRTRKQGSMRRDSSNGFDDDSLRHMLDSQRHSLYSVASSSRGEDEEYELPLKEDSEKEKCSEGTTSMRRTSLTSLLRRGAH